MTMYRLTQSAADDIRSILAWSHRQFGERAGQRYESLIVAAIRDAASAEGAMRRQARPELGQGVFSWHLAQSRDTSSAGLVRRPRHFLICRMEAEVLVVGRVLHDAMDLPRHVPPNENWD